MNRLKITLPDLPNSAAASGEHAQDFSSGVSDRPSRDAAVLAALGLAPPQETVADPATDLSTDLAASGSLSSAACSLRGRRHRHNEDAFIIAPELGLFAVADGISGLQNGQFASRLAISAAASFLQSKIGMDETPLQAQRAVTLYWLEQSIRVAHDALMRAGQRHGSPMGCTLDIVLVRGNFAFIAHVGDSRVYHLRERRLAVLTHDHTLTQKLMGLGIGDPDTLNPRFKHVLTMAIGVNGALQPELSSIELRSGDWLLLCSDGLHNEVSPESIQTLIQGHASTAAWSLIKRVAAQEGVDDATAVLIAKK